MNFLGIGVDIIDNLRIKKSILNKKFVKRIFTKNEINISKKINNKTSFFSKRFAAKEAFSKALGTGFRMNLNFKDIEVVNDKMGTCVKVREKSLVVQVVVFVKIVSVCMNVKKIENDAISELAELYIKKE